jgi:hypothetical protein
LLQNNNDEVISSFQPTTNPTNSMESNNEKVIGSTQRVGTNSTPKAKPEAEEKLALYSSKNVSWPGVGKILKGYNIVTKSASEKWLQRDHVRVASPEEVARNFGR